MEVPLTGGAAVEEHNPDMPLPSTCERNCSCLCHLQWPGMKLIWVPVEADTHVEDDEREEEAADEQQSLEDSEEWEEDEKVECEEDELTPVVDDVEMLRQSKGMFQQSLNVLMAEGQRRLSDPGPHSVISLAITRSQSPPIPPKQTVQIQIHPSMSDEENIYEATLPVVELPPRKNVPACKEIDIPLIKVRKAAQRSKLSYSNSDPTSEFQVPQDADSAAPTPPAIPPRMPLTPVHRTGIPLPQPTLEEWRMLRPSSPSRLSPQRAATPPLNVPHRAPPPPPNPRRLSGASLQSLPEKKGLFQNNAIP